jgi:protoheme IX farnesyltransferase
MRTTASAGLALRLTAVAAAAGCALAVVTGALDVRSAHSLAAELTAPPLLALLLAGLCSHRRLLPWSVASLALFGAAAAVTTRGAHLAFAALAFAAVCATAARAVRGEPLARGSARDYLTLTKPRIMSLLLVTGACGMVVGARGWPGTVRFAIAMLGLALACGGASALNHLLDRDIDRLMGKRTQGRPVATGRLAPARALEFGLALSACSFTLLAATVNVLTAVLALVGNAFYVLVYTGYLKRRGPQNIVLGGAAGAVPPLVGYAAATGSVGVPALWLFVIVFLWTPPHFWALALLLRDHYAAAKVPMLPVAAGVARTVRQITVYTVALVAVTVLPYLTGTFGAVYLAAAVALGAVFLVLAVRLRGGRRGDAALTFHFSLLYLALLFTAAAVDAAL